MTAPSVKFYLTNVEEQDKNGLPVIVKDVLFFSLERASRTGVKDAPPTLFDNKATKNHLIEYPAAYKEFKKTAPEYRCKWPELGLDEEPKVEEPAEEVE